MASPQGTFMPGTKVQVGSHRVVVEKYLSEGGFAHVYVVRLPQPVDGADLAVLKRVAVPDKAALASMRTEVETMKKLRGHRHIVTYIDSHASQLQGGGYEVFLLMEFCARGGLMDFMNTRLQNRLTEPEILKIFGDVTEGVACMHYLKPPLLHRDLKVENVLISLSGNRFRYKLCDFGSAAPPRPAATNAAEGRLIEEDVQRHTTLQYRSPEMIDVYRGHAIDEKSDIWALGVLLYKLCYYTTPFEDSGPMAILNASFKYPGYPPFSDTLKILIASMLRENPRERPNIYQVLAKTCQMSGREVPIHDIYARSRSQVTPRDPPPTPRETPKIGATFSPPMQETQIIPDIAPMRRGRPSRPSQPSSTKPSPSPMRMTSIDPFSALDGTRSKPNAPDELSARFPTLDQFSLFHEKGGKFDFESTVAEKPQEDISRRITNALADEAFARPLSTTTSKSPGPPLPARPLEASRSPGPPLPARPVENEKLKPKPTSDLRGELTRQHTTELYSPSPRKPHMVSRGTMTSPIPSPHSTDPPTYSSRPVYHFPSTEKPKLMDRFAAQEKPRVTETEIHPRERSESSHPLHSRVHSAARHVLDDIQPPASSRPSLEGARPLDIDVAPIRSRSANAKPRPTSAFLSKADYNEIGGSSFDEYPRLHYDGGENLHPSKSEADRANISSDVDYLRAMEEEQNRKKEKRLSSGSKHAKRSSLTSMSITGARLLSGRFSDAFRRFESNGSGRRSRSPSPTANYLTPITGSIATDISDEDEPARYEDGDDVSPEVRREFERLQLTEEERRVAAAQAEYRARLAEHGEARPERSAAIQNRVQLLLNKETGTKPVPKTASGYGRFTDTGNTSTPRDRSAEQSDEDDDDDDERPPPLPARNPSVHRSISGYTSSIASNRPVPPPKDAIITKHASIKSPQPAHRSREDLRGPAVGGSATISVSSGASGTTARPAAPPKPIKLRTTQHTGDSTAASTGGAAMGTSTTTLIDTGSPDWEASFSKRYPSLHGLELQMVETNIGGNSTTGRRTVRP